MRKWKKLELAFEFLVFGIVIGIAEDLIAVKLATGELITWRIIGIIVLIAIPFAVIGELFADNVDFIKIFQKIFSKRHRNDSGQSVINQG